MRIVLPKTRVSEHEIRTVPIFFLMGPIAGGNDWQVRACNLLKENVEEEFAVYVPCRWRENHILKSFFVRSEDQPVSQTVWERRGLDLAGRLAWRGCIICWLPEESKTFPRDDGEPYARDTRGEIGEWRGQMLFDDRIRFAIGGEGGFSGLGVIKKNFDDAFKTDFPIYSSLEDTVSQAVGIAMFKENSFFVR